MRLIDVLNSPWAIVPEKLLEIREIYLTHLRGEKIDIHAIEAQLGKPLNNEPKPYQVERGVAVLSLEGIVAKRMNMFTRISGGTSTQLLARDFRQALADPAARSILLVVDSPGGEVDGTLEMARLVRESRGQKPIIALADSMMASAAYWIGSAADRIFMVGETTSVGSIGVVATHVDYSGAYEQKGIKVTEITAGKYKRIASEFAPLSEEGRKTIQDEVDYIYSLFVEDIARQRGVSVETVLSKMADGRVFLGPAAIQAGLVDGAATREALIADLERQSTAAVQRAVAQELTERREKWTSKC